MSFSGNSNENSTATVNNDGWWPDFTVADFQSRYRLPSGYAEGVLIDGLQIGMAWANIQLRNWRADLAGFEYANLNDVPADKLGEESILLVHYRRAVYSHAKAYLLQQFPTINRRESANNEARESEETESKFLEYAQQAIADLQGVGRATVVLI